MRMTVLIVAFVVVLCGCAQRNLSSTRGLCNAYTPSYSRNGQGGCMDQLDICEAFTAQLDTFETCEECLAHCDETEARLRRQHRLDGCDRYIDKARDLSKQYCRSHYRKSQP